MYRLVLLYAGPLHSGWVIQWVLDIQMAWVIGGHRLGCNTWIRQIRMLVSDSGLLALVYRGLSCFAVRGEAGKGGI